MPNCNENFIKRNEFLIYISTYFESKKSSKHIFDVMKLNEGRINLKIKFIMEATQEETKQIPGVSYQPIILIHDFSLLG